MTIKFLKLFILIAFCSGIMLACSSSDNNRDEAIGSISSLTDSGTSDEGTQNDKGTQSEEDPKTNEESSEAQEPTTKLPKPDIQLPDIGYDKSKLSEIQKLDQMLTDHATLELVLKIIYEEYQKLEEASDASMSGTPEDLTKAVMKMVNGVNHFNTYAIEIGDKALHMFRKKYNNDDTFNESYRDTYLAAEDQLSVQEDGSVIIADREKRNQVSTRFRNGYPASAFSDASNIERLITESKQIKENIIRKVLDQANTDISVVDYLSGKNLTDRLNTTVNLLNIVRTLDPYHEEIKSKLQEIEEKRKSRLKEIKQALNEYRFPERYASGNAPSNASALESRMKNYLSKSKYTSTENYQVLKILVAGPWIDVHHSLSGIHMYSQIDFYVAVPGEEAGTVDVLLVTGKTGGPHHDSFASHWVGGIGQMLRVNL